MAGLGHLTKHIYGLFSRRNHNLILRLQDDILGRIVLDEEPVKVNVYRSARDTKRGLNGEACAVVSERLPPETHHTIVLSSRRIQRLTRNLGGIECSLVCKAACLPDNVREA